MRSGSWRRLASAGGALLIAVLASGCVTTAEQGRRMRQDIDGLQVAAEEQRETLQGLRRDLDRLTTAIEGLTGNLDSARRTDANFGATVDRLMADLQQVQGGVEELRYHLEQVQRDQVTFREETERRLAALKGDEALATYEAKKATQAAARPDSPGPFLDDARRRIEGGDTRVGRNLVEEFQRRWPKDSRAPDAQLLLADSWWREKNWRAAAQAYGNFREKWPKHPKMPLALVRLGEAFVRLGFKDEGRQFFDAVIKQYPNAPEARQARRQKQEFGL